MDGREKTNYITFYDVPLEILPSEPGPPNWHESGVQHNYFDDLEQNTFLPGKTSEKFINIRNCYVILKDNSKECKFICLAAFILFYNRKV